MKKVIYRTFLLILIPIISLGQEEYKKTIYFASNSSTLDQKSLKVIDSLANICATHPNFSLTLFGHTDDVGSEEFNQKLSENRVAAVTAYFISKNISSEKIKSDVFGETKPFASNDSESNRAKNRRVEINLTLPSVTFTETTPVRKENPEMEPWPGSKAILISPGTKSYSVPELPGVEVEISVITNTSEMEAENFTTYTTDGIALSSNLIVCVRRPVRMNCDLPHPVDLYIPVSANPYCKGPSVKFYDAEKDSVGNGMVKWKEILPGFRTEWHGEVEYFVITISNLCSNPCKNFDCPKLRTAKAKIKLKGRKYRLDQVDAIHETANALLPGLELAKNYWQVEYFDFEGVDLPKIKFTLTNKFTLIKRKKKLVKRYLLADLKKDSEGTYILSKKQIKTN